MRVECVLILISEAIHHFFVKIDAIYAYPWVVDMKYKPLNKLHWKARLSWYTYFLLSFSRRLFLLLLVLAIVVESVALL